MEWQVLHFNSINVAFPAVIFPSGRENPLPVLGPYSHPEIKIIVRPINSAYVYFINNLQVKYILTFCTVFGFDLHQSRLEVRIAANSPGLV